MFDPEKIQRRPAFKRDSRRDQVSMYDDDGDPTGETFEVEVMFVEALGTDGLLYSVSNTVSAAACDALEGEGIEMLWRGLESSLLGRMYVKAAVDLPPYMAMGRAMEIFQSYPHRSGGFGADHDVLYGGPSPAQVSEEDTGILARLGWHPESASECFRLFV